MADEHQVEEPEAVPCSVCRRPLRDTDPPRTCGQCVGRARADLHGIVNAYALLPAVLHSPPGVERSPPAGGRPTDVAATVTAAWSEPQIRAAFAAATYTVPDDGGFAVDRVDVDDLITELREHHP